MLGSVVIESEPARNAPLIAGAVALALHARGGRRARTAARLGTLRPERVRLERNRTLVFALALAILVVSLQQPVDDYADRYLWMHMVQHVLLLTIVPPLMLLAAPWMRIWRGLPLALRRPLAAWAVNARSAAPLRILAHALAHPGVAWTAFTLDVVLWHLPGAYDLTVRSEIVHDLEHVSFLLFALLAWGQVIDSPPFRSRLDHPRRIAFAVASMFASWGLAIVLAFASSPFYPAYAELRHGSLSALTDQHLAGGIMWVPGSVSWSLAVFILLYRWLWPLAPAEDGREPQPATIVPDLPPWPVGSEGETAPAPPVRALAGASAQGSIDG